MDLLIVKYRLKIQNPVNKSFTGLIVESERIELSSKQAIKEPSTRLVFHWFFDAELAKDNPLNTYLFNLESASKRHTI